MPVKLSSPPLAPIGSDPSTFDYQWQHLTLLSHIRAVVRQHRLLPRKPTGVVRYPSPLSAGKAGLDGRVLLLPHIVREIDGHGIIWCTVEFECGERFTLGKHHDRDALGLIR
jgi:hypothetical protein